MTMRYRFVAALLLMTAACGGPMKYQVASSPKAPGADAKLVADIKAKNNVTNVDFSAEHLPPPTRIAEGSTTYMAWYRESSHQAWQRIGGLDYDEDSRKAALLGSVPATAFDFAVTVESESTVASPSPDVVFAQRVQTDD